MEPLKRFEARSAKAKVSVIEARDTNDPALVTQMLMPLLEAVGSRVEAPRLRKRVRDDVNIQHAEFPWRRLPFWLVLRVESQEIVYSDRKTKVSEIRICLFSSDVERLPTHG